MTQEETAENVLHPVQETRAGEERVPPITHISTFGPGTAEELRECWDYRSLFFFLVWRDIKVRYAQTVLGGAWALLQPLLTMAVFTVIFGYLANVPSEGVPYALFALTALVPWFYFSTALSMSSSSLVGNANLLTKIYFPRMAIPLAPVFAGLLDLLVSSALLAASLLYYGVVPSPSAAIYVPAALCAIILTAAGSGCLLAALNVRFRDVKYVVPFLVQIWMYASPIAYPMSLVPEPYRILYAANPLAGPIEALRASLLRSGPVNQEAFFLSFCVSLLIFIAGARYFRYMERTFADVV